MFKEVIMKKYIITMLSVLLIVSFCSCDFASTPHKQSQEDIQENIVDIDEAVTEETVDETIDESKDETAPEDIPIVDSVYDECVEYGLPIPTQTHSFDNGDKLILVNKQYAITSDFYPTDMVAVDGSLSTNQGLYFKRDAYDAYLKMLSDANEEGIDFLICSTYRSYDTQYSIYHYHIDNYGLDYTNTVSAYPGRSEHHTGWAVDITSPAMGYDLLESFIDYPEGQWINDHCHEYGFIIRYPKDKTHITGYSYEPWHLRYVGVDVATEIMSKGITLEEYLGVA